MNDAHLHLIVNHVSVLCLLIGVISLGISMKRKSVDLRVMATVLFIVAGIFVLITFQTGEGAEDIIKSLDAGAESFIEQHEQAALWARRSGIWVALLAIATEWSIRKKKKWSKYMPWALLVFALHGISVYLATSNLGGQIRHTEVRSSESPSP